MVNHSTTVSEVLETVSVMVDQIRSGHERAEMIRADLQAYVSEAASVAQGNARGDLLTMLLWRYPGYVEVRPIADVLGILPTSLRIAAGR